jgi:hypothetical protein
MAIAKGKHGTDMLVGSTKRAEKTPSNEAEAKR